MGCSVHADLAKAPRPRVSVNGVVIPRDAIARETQNHPAQSPVAAWQEAARALVIRELLLQEASRLDVPAAPETDGDGRCETDEEARIRALFAREAQTPEPDEETCRRYYQQNRAKFRSPDIYEATHILFAASRNDREVYRGARAQAQAVLTILAHEPDRFAELAKAHSACPSAEQGGNLGQITAGQTTPEFEKTLLGLQPGAITPIPVETRYGFHIVRLDRRISGGQLPFELAHETIADFLATRVRWMAAAQYVARLATRARIEGIQLADPASLRVA